MTPHLPMLHIVFQLRNVHHEARTLLGDEHGGGIADGIAQVAVEVARQRRTL